MALKNDFYSEIESKEENWSEMIKKNLLTSVYCKFELKPFYVEKKQELELELKESDNLILSSMLSAVDAIINKLDLFIKQYETLEPVDFTTLLPLLLISQMRNSSRKNRIEVLKQERQKLEKKVAEYREIKSKEDYDYVYDNFYEDEHKKIA